MAKLPAGLFGPIAGQIAGLVFGRARDRDGKPTTARILVIPANPNSAGQQIVRGQLKDAVYVSRGWTPTMWHTDWDRSVGQLAGFQSLVSILCKCAGSTFILSAPAQTPLGTLHLPDTVTFAGGAGAGTIKVTWSTELGYDGTAGDLFKIAICEASRTGAGVHPYASVLAGAARSTGAAGITTPAIGIGINALCVFWGVGAGSAAGKTTPAKWAIQITT